MEMVHTIMNGKKAKMLRKSGEVDKKTKKMYNALSSEQRRVLGQLTKAIEENPHRPQYVKGKEIY